MDPTSEQPAAPIGRGAAPSRHGFRWNWGAGLVVGLLLAGHGFVVFTALGGWTAITSDWPMLQADHGLHFVHAITTRHFLQQGGVTAGYDPTFMAGFPMSVISGTSSTLSNLVVWLGGRAHPAVAYKVFVLVGVSLTPVLLAWAAGMFGCSGRGVVWAVALFLIYFWIDFPKNYARYGMVGFLIANPVGLIALATLLRYIERGGLVRWLWAVVACSVVFLIHLMTPMVIAPGAVAGLAVLWWRRRRGEAVSPLARLMGLIAMTPVILAANAFWWLPGFWLRSTVGVTEFVFSHPESVVLRLVAIFWNEAEVEPLILGCGVVGLILLGSARPTMASGLAGLILAGFGWGYLAGAFRALDGLQPGRQTYPFYLGLCVAGGYALEQVGDWIKAARPGRFDRWLAVVFVLVGLRFFGPKVAREFAGGVFTEVPLLSSRPLPAMVRLLDNLRRHVKPGDRLLFEENGLALPGVRDDFYTHHFSPYIPLATGVEVLGGPYLHTPVTTNFTQFGEGKLFGDRNWGRDQFVRYARLYRPTAIACYTPQARAFCRQNPDLIQTIDDDGVILLARVIGFGGATIRGQAEVQAAPNQLVVRNAVAAADGLVVLRYHAVPCLVADPPLAIEPVYLEADPVPFIGLRPRGPEPITLRMKFPPPTGWLASPALAPRP